MKVYITTGLSLILLMSILYIFAPMWVVMTVNYIVLCWILFIAFSLEQRIQIESKTQQTRLVEAGNAITDTLRVAFDNLKKLTVSGGKTQIKINDHESRIRRLEQQIQKSGKPSKLATKPEPETLPKINKQSKDSEVDKDE